MAWFLALQSAATTNHQSPVYELADSVDVKQVAEELASAAVLDRVVPITALLPQNSRQRQLVTLYVRPAAWGVWTFYQLSEEDRLDLARENPMLHMLAQAAEQQQRAQAGSAGPQPPQPPQFIPMQTPAPGQPGRP